jgi:hypothetical protein
MLGSDASAMFPRGVRVFVFSENFAGGDEANQCVPRQG